jgi:3-oxoacyl-(acyl-carrier-protein) synthase
VRSITAGLARLGLGPEGLDAVVCGASGARRGDRLEAAVIRRLFPAGPPPVFAPKGVTGEYGGAFLAAALLALDGRLLAPPEAFGQADPELGVVPYDGSEPGPLRRLLLLGTAAGGAAAWGILEAPAP